MAFQSGSLAFTLDGIGRSLTDGNSAAFNLSVAGGTVAAAIVLYLIFVAIGRLLKRRLATRLGAIYQLFSAVFAAYLAVVLFRPPFVTTRELGAMSSVFGAGVLIRLLDQYFWRWYFEERRKAPIPKFVREVTGLLVFIVTVVLVLQFGYDVRVPGLLAASGVVGIILGFALQDSLGNIIGGFALQFGRPFSVGDWLLLDQVHAQAVEINWRSTRFVTTDSVQLDVPNQQIVRQTIVNYHGGTSLHAMRLEIGVDSETPPNRVKDALLRATAAAEGVLADPAPGVYMKNFGDSAVIYEIRFWLDDHRLYNTVADAVRTNVWYALRRQRIKIPYPVRHLQIERARASDPGAGHAAVHPRESTRELLARQPLFQGMREDGLSTLVSRSPIHHYGRGEAIIHEKADGASMFVLVTGEAAVNVLLDHQQTRVATLRDGDCFGEMSLLTGEKRSASVLAVIDCEVMEITKRTFGEVIARDTDLLQRLSALLAQRQMANDGIVQARAQHPALVEAKQQEYQDGFLDKLRSFFEL